MSKSPSAAENPEPADKPEAQAASELTPELPEAEPTPTLSEWARPGSDDPEPKKVSPAPEPKKVSPAPEPTQHQPPANLPVPWTPSPLGTTPYPVPYQYPYYGNYHYYPYAYPPVPPRPMNGLALGSLITGIVTLAMCQPLGIAAIIMGHSARGQIAETNEDGSGMATAGIILGWAGVIITIGLILLFLVPFLLVAIFAASL